eukprot:CAMPEP_0118931556 /NCGR_PEP_ID=MMETSP1169-20130426/7854_1 /TAXON_ID=36882 /ORGANISM="Pyramimonas obovata, Strain CCMP722" /LENGTH=284 /DNA_ID=CAMNT_0006874067 /DNA_START=186 /DNA_END=1037 /DNA_ORIENTATION=+
MPAKPRSDNANQAALWSDTTTLWHIVRSVSQVQTFDARAEKTLGRTGKRARTTQEIVDISKKSLMYEVKTDRVHSCRATLLDIYEELSGLGENTEEEDGVVDTYCENLDKTASSSKTPDRASHLTFSETIDQLYRRDVEKNEVQNITEMIELVLKKVDLGIRSRHIWQEDRDVHPLLTLFKLRMFLRARSRDLPSDEDLLFSPLNRGPVGETVSHMCLLLWQGEGFDPRWAEDNAFLWADPPGEAPLIPETANLIRLVLWMIYEYGKDVINVPFHKGEQASPYE